MEWRIRVLQRWPSLWQDNVRSLQRSPKTLVSQENSIMSIVAIAGSPRENSQSRRLLDHAVHELSDWGFAVRLISVRDLPATDLLHARFDSPPLQEAITLVQQAAGVLIATPVYQAAYSGILKAFLDLLPRRALNGKVVLPIATGGSAAHRLALDYSLRPVLAALGTPHVLGGLYVFDSQMGGSSAHGLWLDPDSRCRLREELQQLLHHLDRLTPAPTRNPSPAEIEHGVAS